MGSVPAQTFKADLNGTGTLVDITTYVAGNRFAHTYGRRDWTSATQQPGTLTVTLENLDGRFTPGSTATYTVGVVRNMTVEWTCGARVRRFYVTSSELAFDIGVAGQSTVTLRCRDALGLLAERDMQELVREATLIGNPVAYWPCDESPSPTGDTTFRDISGNGQPSLRPFTKETGVAPTYVVESGYMDSGGRGPRTDSAGAPVLNETGAPIDLTVAPAHRAGARNNLNWTTDDTYIPGLNRQVTIPDRTAPYIWTGGPPAPNTVTYPSSGWLDSSGNSYDYVISFWFSLDDVYGGTSSTAALTDGPYVMLATVNLWGGDHAEWHIMYRIPDRRIVIASPVDIKVLSTDSYSISPGDVHHLALAVQHKENVYSGGSYVPIAAPVKGYVDGVALSTGSVSLGAVGFPIGVTLGTHVVANPLRTGANTRIYALTGTISNVSLHPPSEVTGAGVWTRAAQVWDTGTTGPLELSDARFNRLGALAQRTMPATLAWSPQGTGQTGLLGPHKTGGKDALTVLCETLSSEEASLDTIYTGGVDTVRAWLDSTQRALTPALTLDAQDDAAAPPDLGFDLSGVVATAEAKGWNSAATWRDTVAANQWAGSSATVASVMASDVDLLLLAQYRTVKGRAGQISPTRVVVDAASSTANVTTALLDLYPGATIRVQGLPSDKIGYSSIDCILIGVTERHGLGTNAFELALIPRITEAYVDPELGTEGPWRLVDQPPWRVSAYDGLLCSSGDTGVFFGLYGSTTGGALSSGATTGYILSNRARGGNATIPPIVTTFMSQDAADYPLSIRVDSEIITLPNPAGAPTSTTVNLGQCWYQQVTGMVRGQQGTTAAGHAALNVTTVASDQGFTVVVPDESLPLLAF
jgi:hypothetical protein